jgi:ferredoxin-thioredoxin reductase catalytic subunit
MDDIEYIENEIRADALKSGYTLKEQNIKKIARAKNMLFGKDNWRRCPCDGSNENRYCGSELCTKDIAEKGVCHCNLHCRGEE